MSEWRNQFNLRIKGRMTRLRDERAYVQEATSQNAIKSCREKFKLETKNGGSSDRVA